MACDNSNLDGYLYSLRTPTLAKLSHMLNPTKVLLTDDGQLRDWRGLAEMMGCEMLTIQNLEKTSNPFGAFFNQIKDLTVNQFIEYLEKMDRYDVIDDTIALMENDLYLASRESNSERTKTEIPQLVTIGDFEHLNEKGTLVQYDAFVLYSREDQEFVDMVVEKMEGEYGMKLCLKDRDLMAGLPFEHQAVTELISDRCRFVLPIFSPNFLNSEDNKFVVNFSEALGIERGCRKIVPCVYQNCDLPKSVRYYTRLDYTRRNQYWDFWEKMSKSLANPTMLPNEKTGKTNANVDSITPEKKKSAPLLPKRNGELFGKIRQLSEALPVSPKPASLKENEMQPLDASKDETGIGREPKHWLKKMWKKSKKKTDDKQKVKVAAY